MLFLFLMNTDINICTKEKDVPEFIQNISDNDIIHCKNYSLKEIIWTKKLLLK